MRDLSERIQRKHKGAGHKILGHWGTGKIIREIKSPSQADSAHPCFSICRLVYLLFQEYKLNTSRYVIQALCWVFYAYSRNQFSIILSILDSSPLIRHFKMVVYRAQSSHGSPACSLGDLIWPHRCQFHICSVNLQCVSLVNSRFIHSVSLDI